MTAYLFALGTLAAGLALGAGAIVVDQGFLLGVAAIISSVTGLIVAIRNGKPKRRR